MQAKVARELGMEGREPDRALASQDGHAVVHGVDVYLRAGGLDDRSTDEDAGEVAAVVIMALALSFLATLYPYWRAARLDPVEALRYE